MISRALRLRVLRHVQEAGFFEQGIEQYPAGVAAVDRGRSHSILAAIERGADDAAASASIIFRSPLSSVAARREHCIIPARTLRHRGVQD
jgi:hypothetical protein